MSCPWTTEGTTVADASRRFREIAYKIELLQKSVQKQVETYADLVMKAKEHLSNAYKGLRVFAESH